MTCDFGFNLEIETRKLDIVDDYFLFRIGRNMLFPSKAPLPFMRGFILIGGRPRPITSAQELAQPLMLVRKPNSLIEIFAANSHTKICTTVVKIFAFLVRL